MESRGDSNDLQRLNASPTAHLFILGRSLGRLTGLNREADGPVKTHPLSPICTPLLNLSCPCSDNQQCSDRQNERRALALLHLRCVEARAASCRSWLQRLQLQQDVLSLFMIVQSAVSCVECRDL